MKEEVRFWHELIAEADTLLSDFYVIEKMKKTIDEEEGFVSEINGRFSALSKKLEQSEIKAFLNGKYDRSSALVSIYSGAGGRDAEDWAQMLVRMYMRWAEKERFDAVLIHEHEGQEGGAKNATLEISGRYAYGYLKGERGVHRLVRISPYSAQKLRHTSFAMVEVLPELEAEDEKSIVLRSDDIKLDTFRSSGPGGQNVNKRETAIRVTHIPSGVSVECQSGRSQAANKEKAMGILKTKLFHLREKEQKKEIDGIKGDVLMKNEWGSQIRSYVLHPYKMVKDHRTEEETSQVELVLEGELGQFIEAEVRKIRC